MNDLDDTSSTILFKSVRELLFNIIKHAGVKSAIVSLNRNESTVTVSVEDEGRGFDSNIDIETGKGLGLFSVKERLQDISGAMLIESEPGVMTKVILSVPWMEKKDDK